MHLNREKWEVFIQERDVDVWTQSSLQVHTKVITFCDCAMWKLNTKFDKQQIKVVASSYAFYLSQLKSYSHSFMKPFLKKVWDDQFLLKFTSLSLLQVIRELPQICSRSVVVQSNFRLWLCCSVMLWYYPLNRGKGKPLWSPGLSFLGQIFPNGGFRSGQPALQVRHHSSFLLSLYLEDRTFNHTCFRRRLRSNRTKWFKGPELKWLIYI